MFKQLDYTMVVVSDMKRSIEFYRDTLGIPLKLESPDWTEFSTGTTTLALHGGGVQRQQSEPFGEGKLAGGCSIGFNVENLDESYGKLKAKGVEFVMPPSEPEGQGIRLAVGLDPDGLHISFAQILGKYEHAG